MSDTPKPEIPLPWERDFNSIYILEDGYRRYIDIDGMMHVNDAKYIVHACNSLPALEARVKELETALEWYGEQARLCRLIHSEGYTGRHNLSNDGGRKASASLSKEACDE